MRTSKERHNFHREHDGDRLYTSAVDLARNTDIPLSDALNYMLGKDCPWYGWEEDPAKLFFRSMERTDIGNEYIPEDDDLPF